MEDKHRNLLETLAVKANKSIFPKAEIRKLSKVMREERK